MEQKKIISTFKQFYTKFSNLIIKKLINFLQLNGKKTIAKKLLIKCLDYIYIKTQKNPVFLLENYIKMSCRFILNYSYVFYYFTQMDNFEGTEDLKIENKLPEIQNEMYNYNNELYKQSLKEIKKHNIEKFYQDEDIDIDFYTKPGYEIISQQTETLIDTNVPNPRKKYKHVEKINKNVNKHLKTKAFSLYSSLYNDINLDKHYNTTNLSLKNYYEFMKNRYTMIDDMEYSEYQPILSDSDFVTLSLYGYEHITTYKDNKIVDKENSLDSVCDADTADFKKSQMFIRIKQGLQNQYTLPVIYSAKFLAFRKKIINYYLRVLVKDFTLSKGIPFHVQLGEEIIKGNCGFITMRETHFAKLNKLFDKTNIQTKLNSANPYTLEYHFKKRKKDLDQIKLLSHVFGMEFAFSVKELKFLTKEYPVLLHNAVTKTSA